ncbi:hypothetical protein J2T23_000853 [Pseudarthrobacter niigatensis]|uniref:Uncharacterized protein n=1 Tax=Pseudarthrobacter niigatensis TaxID=369935 RepID=A0AAJ1WEL6_9MICC|nr:hypothetical protein [Pseudarthrobacter niigatensis]MDQ0264407.1 hypothetical protein [Pseudarthrobacter niigatensis]
MRESIGVFAATSFLMLTSALTPLPANADSGYVGGGDAYVAPPAPPVPTPPPGPTCTNPHPVSGCAVAPAPPAPASAPAPYVPATPAPIVPAPQPVNRVPAPVYVPPAPVVEPQTVYVAPAGVPGYQAPGTPDEARGVYTVYEVPAAVGKALEAPIDIEGEALPAAAEEAPSVEAPLASVTVPEQSVPPAIPLPASDEGDGVGTTEVIPVSSDASIDSWWIIGAALVVLAAAAAASFLFRRSKV